MATRFLSIKSHGVSVTWAGGRLPDAVGHKPSQSLEVLPTPSLQQGPLQVCGLPGEPGPGLLSARPSFLHWTWRLWPFSGLSGTNLKVLSLSPLPTAPGR